MKKPTEGPRRIGAMNGLRRHTLVWLSQAPRADTEDDRVRAVRWHEAGRPFIVSRRRNDGHEVGLGFCTTDPTHPELRPRRVAALTDPSQIVRTARPPSTRSRSARPQRQGPIPSPD
ncbi:MAG: hypothetical protein KA171_13605 [Reyranella sp.]|nr:hypothetical protein [Reyranella sp.]